MADNTAKKTEAPVKKKSVIAAIVKWVYFIVGIVVVALVILNMNGIKLQNQALLLYLCMGYFVALLIGATVLLARKIKNATVCMIIVMLMVLLTGFVGTTCFSFASLYGTTYAPKVFRTEKSPAGKNVALFYAYSDNMINERRAARTGGDEEADFIIEDYSYQFTAYPRMLGVFYDARQPSEGEMYVTYAEDAALREKVKTEWTDDNTWRVYTDEPGEFDSGELTLTLK